MSLFVLTHTLGLRYYGYGEKVDVSTKAPRTKPMAWRDLTRLATPLTGSRSNGNNYFLIFRSNRLESYGTLCFP